MIVYTCDITRWATKTSRQTS